MATQPPGPLELAIENAANSYHVPKDLLEGIWREESGSTYPNPAVNSSGYGGLFGTRNPFASTQDQANTAASVLATGLRQSGGNVAQALSFYNSGRLTGGYTSVPGETTFGVTAVPPDPGGVAAAGLNPGTNTQTTQGAYGAANGSPDVSAGIQNVSVLSGVGGFVGSTVLRGIEVFGGIMLVVLGLVGLFLAVRSSGASVGDLAKVIGANANRPSSSSPSPSPSPAPASSEPSRRELRAEANRRLPQQRKRAGFLAAEEQDRRERRARLKARATAGRASSSEIPF